MADQNSNQKQQNKRGGEQGRPVGNYNPGNRLAKVCRAAESPPLMSREGLFWGGGSQSVTRECESWADRQAGREK